jgi:hypothetical protein
MVLPHINQLFGSSWLQPISPYYFLNTNFLHNSCFTLHGFRLQAEAREFSLLQNVQTVSEAHSNSHSKNKGALFLGVNLPARESDHWFLSSTDVKNSWCYKLTPTCNFMFFTRTILPLTFYFKNEFMIFYWIAWPLKMGPIDCPETSVTTY